MELHPSEAAREAVRLLVGPLPADAVPDALRRWLDGPAQAGLGLPEVRWLRERRAADGASEPLSDLMAGGRMELPSPVSPARNPDLEARCRRLRAEQEERSYRRMVRNVDNSRLREPTLQIGKQMREVNAQLVEVGQVIFSVAAAFLFGYVATAVAAGNADTATRILVGLAAALIVLIAEGYFLLRYLSYTDDPPPMPTVSHAGASSAKITAAASSAKITAGASSAKITAAASSAKITAGASSAKITAAASSADARPAAVADASAPKPAPLAVKKRQ